DKERLTEREETPEFFASIPDEFRARFSRVVELLAEVVGPKLSADSPEKIKQSLDRLLKEIRAHGLPSLAAEAACLHIYPDQKADVYRRISEALISNQHDIQSDSLRAIVKIILDCSDAAVISAETDLTLMLSQYLTWCPTHSIS